MLSDSVKNEIGVALRKDFSTMTPRDIDLLWRYTANTPMDVLLEMYPV